MSKNRREREIEQMRENILNTALKLTLNEGFENVSIRKIADTIEYSPAAIYSYFKDKEEIYLEIYSIVIEALVNKIMPTENIEIGINMLIEISNKYVEFGIENPEYYDFLYSMLKSFEEINFRMAIMEKGLMLFEGFTLNVQAAQAEGYFEGHNAKTMALLWLSFGHGIIDLNNNKRVEMFFKDEDTKIVVKQTIEAFYSGFKK